MSTSRRRAVRRWLVIIAVTAMVAVPTAALFEPQSARFGWQMFTGITVLPAVWVETVDGGERRVDVHARLVHLRPEAELGPALAQALCQQTEIRAVVIDSLSGRTRISC